MLGANLLKGSTVIPEQQLRYYFIQVTEADMQAELINKKLVALKDTVEAAWEFYRKPRAPAKVVVMQSSVVAPRPGM